jgi:phosphate transport system substrate-binding protein
MKRAFLAVIPAMGILLAACGSSSTSNLPGVTPTNAFTIPTPPAAELLGAGATFPYPFYSAAFYAYNLKFSQVKVTYNSIGSGGGISALTAKTVNFGASDVPLKDSEAAAMGGRAAVVQIPVTLGTESLAYNLQGVGDGQLKLTPDLIAGIFLGTIKTWNDPALAAINTGVSLPSQPISVVHRSDGSGTTYIFTDYLSNVSADWKSKVGTGKSVAWPTGQGAKGNELVATTIKTTPGAIGYVELAYVLQTHMTQAKLQNANGAFVEPSAAGATAAAATKPNVTPTDFSIVNAAGKDSAPISGYSWAMLYVAQPDQIKGQALVDVLYWLVSPDGQQYATNLNYAKLPDNIAKADIVALKTVTYNGTPLLTVS